MRRTRSRAASPASRFRRPTARPRRAFSPLAARAKIPVVVADIGTNSGDYVSFIISDNYQGAFGVGEALAAALKEKGWTDGSIGLITISQARKNGQARTAGFRDAMKNAGHHQGSRPAADAVLYRRRDVQVHPGHADRQPEHARHVHPDRPADHRRAARHQGGPSRRHAAGRRLRRHSGIRRSSQEGRDRRLRHAAALSHGREIGRSADQRAQGRERRRSRSWFRSSSPPARTSTRSCRPSKRPCSPTNCSDKDGGRRVSAGLRPERNDDRPGDSASGGARDLEELRADARARRRQSHLAAGRHPCAPGRQRRGQVDALPRHFRSRPSRRGRDPLSRRTARRPQPARGARRWHRHGHAGDQPCAGPVGSGEHFPPRPRPARPPVAPDDAPAGERDSRRSRSGARGLARRRGA